MTFGKSRRSERNLYRETELRLIKAMGMVDHVQKGSGKLSYLPANHEHIYKPRDRELWAWCDGSKVAHFFLKNPIGDSHSVCSNFVSDCVEIADFGDEFCKDCLVFNAIRTYAKP